MCVGVGECVCECVCVCVCVCVSVCEIVCECVCSEDALCFAAFAVTVCSCV